MSILRSNNAHFKITVEWLEQRGYVPRYEHWDQGKVVLLDYPLYYTQKPICVTRGTQHEKIELLWVAVRGSLDFRVELECLIGIIWNGTRQHRMAFRADEVNKLIKLENMWDKKREVC